MSSTPQTSSAATVRVSRRAIGLETIDQAIAEAERLAGLERSGRAQYAGNWTVGQILNHLAVWAEYQYTPCPITAPWYIRLGGRMVKGRILKKGIPAGANIPKVKGGTLAIELVPADVALARFKPAFERLKRDTPTCPSPMFGLLTREEAVMLNLRHSELHFSFVIG